MGWANASYYSAIGEHLPKDVEFGKQALRFLTEIKELSVESREALRRYSTAQHAGAMDGKALNASLIDGDDIYSDWAQALSEACVWTFNKPVLLWRGGHLNSEKSGSPSFVSTTLVERQARQFRSRGNRSLSAIILPAGSAVAIPAMVWTDRDDDRTLGVVRREVEITLPAGTSFAPICEVNPFENRDPNYPIKISIVKAVVPTHDLRPKMGF